MTSSAAPRRIGRPPAFQADDAVTVALGIGIADFSMTRVARRLGVTAPALYRLFPDREALHRACLDEIRRRTPPVRDADTSRDLLDHFAAAVWEMLIRFPGLPAVEPGIAGDLRIADNADHADNADQSDDAPATVTSRLRDLGFSPDQASFAVQYIADLAVGTAAHLQNLLPQFPVDPTDPDAPTLHDEHGHRITGADELTASFRRQFISYTEFFLDHLDRVAPDWPGVR